MRISTAFTCTIRLMERQYQLIWHAQTVTDSRGLECFFIYSEAYYSAFACKHTVSSIETTFMDQ